MACKSKVKVNLSGIGVVLVGLALSSQAAANRPLGSIFDVATAAIVVPANTQVEASRLVSYFFSAEAWGGLPFSEEQMRQVMVQAMMERSLVRMELPVTHLLSASAAHIRTFTAVYEIDGRGDAPTLRAGYELELLVPRSEVPVMVEIINGDTGITNRVEVAPEGSL